MGWSIPAGRIAGTAIRIHLTFFLLLVWIGTLLYLEGGGEAAFQGIGFILLLFTCVLLHEFGHVLAARRYGIVTPEIILLPIGGVSRMERIPEKPSQEMAVALAGPIVSVAIAGVLYLILGRFSLPTSTDFQGTKINIVESLAYVNLVLAMFNLLPAFPMDGGRVLRALLASRLGYARGTQIAASVGQVAAFGLGLLGLFGNPILILIALFVYLGAASEAHAVQLREAAQSLVAADAVITKLETLSQKSCVEDAVECLIRTTQHEFPIVDDEHRLRGLLTRDDMIRALRDSGPRTPVGGVMRSDIPTVTARSKLDEALRLMQEKQSPAVGVVDGEGHLLGIITPENIGEMMMVQAARPAHPKSPAGQTNTRPIFSRGL
jgi:stage IV sporulation protein FB